MGVGSGGDGRVGGRGRVGGVRVDVNEEFKILGRFTKKIRGGGGSGGEGVGLGSRWWGFWEDVNAMLRVGGDVGYGGCEPNRRYCTMYEKVLNNIKKMKKMCVWGGGGEEAIIAPKTLSMYLKKKKKKSKKKKKMTEPGLEPTTSGFEIH